MMGTDDSVIDLALATSLCDRQIYNVVLLPSRMNMFLHPSDPSLLSLLYGMTYNGLSNRHYCPLSPQVNS